MYITRDEGLTFTKVTFSQPINPRSLQWYPGEDNWILGLNTQSDVVGGTGGEGVPSTPYVPTAVCDPRHRDFMDTG